MSAPPVQPSFTKLGGPEIPVWRAATHVAGRQQTCKVLSLEARGFTTTFASKKRNQKLSLVVYAR
jgi:hypothetical protein